ncbi:hypothetical protein JMJ55_25365 [Belnapia sp. T6]|uniref:Tail specific protease domain-containing protein n=1 Tax=Belnapia mucosa TaxID=2804532 RepID=A0ABS1VAI2_9PROT|nr:S41 family peptidase [Belnapia mucosa]MBL6458670.1 hypothetical protein [Belnapia mucosa]
MAEDQNKNVASRNVPPFFGDAQVDLETAKRLDKFLEQRRRVLNLEKRLEIVDDAISVVEDLYITKIGESGDPLEGLRTLQRELKERVDAGANNYAGKGGPDWLREDDLEFHAEMIRAFTGLRDLHTGYVPPPPFDKAVAFLPFEVEACWEGGERKYIVSNVYKKLPWYNLPKDFERGVEVIRWGEDPMAKAVEMSGDKTSGANAATKLSLGLDRMTAVPLARARCPLDWGVKLTYRTMPGEGQAEEKETEEPVPWYVATIQSEDPEVGRRNETWRALGQGLDDGREAVRQLRRTVHQQEGQAWLPERAKPADRKLVSNVRADKVLEMPEHCEASIVTPYAGDNARSGEEYGYIRIRSFKVANHRSYVRKFARLVAQMPLNGIILDVRDNPGGLILAAERLLQIFTPEYIKPQEMVFRNTGLSRKVIKLVPEYRWRGPDQAPKRPGRGKPRHYSKPAPISSEILCNNVGQHYYGPVVLITNALSYSATELFAAGFKKYEIGKVLGTEKKTGGGRSNVVTRSTLWKNFEHAKRAFGTLKDAAAAQGEKPQDWLREPKWPLKLERPLDTDLRVTIRGVLSDGGKLHNGGVTRDFPHRMTRADVLEDNKDLLKTAADLLKELKKERSPCQLRETSCYKEGDTIVARIKTGNIDILKLFLDQENKARVTAHVANGVHPYEIRGWDAGKGKLLRLEGYSDDNGTTPVATRKIRLQ